MEPTPITLEALAAAEPQTAPCGPAVGDAFAQLIAALTAPLATVPSPPAAEVPPEGEAAPGEPAPAPAPTETGESAEPPTDPDPTGLPKQPEQHAIAGLIEAATAEAVPGAAPISTVPPMAEGHAVPHAHLDRGAPQQPQPAAVPAPPGGDGAFVLTPQDAVPTAPAADHAPAGSPEPARTIPASIGPAESRPLTAQANAAADMPPVPPTTYSPGTTRDIAVPQSPQRADTVGAANQLLPGADIAATLPEVMLESPVVARDDHAPPSVAAGPEPPLPLPDGAAIESPAQRQPVPQPALTKPLAASQPSAEAPANVLDPFSAVGDGPQSSQVAGEPPTPGQADQGGPAARATVVGGLPPSPQTALSPPLPARSAGDNAGVAEPSILATNTNASVTSDGQQLLAATS